MTMRTLLAILLLIAMIPLAHAAGKKPPQTPGTQTRGFLDKYGQEPALMDLKRIKKMRTVFSKGLIAKLSAARIAQETSTAEHPGDKPGLVELGFNSGEGNAFDSYDIRLTNMLDTKRAAVDVEFVANAEGTPVRWRDRYEWVLEGSTWKLDDVVFRSTGRPGPRDRRLTKLLQPASAPAGRLLPERPPAKAGQSR